MLAEIWAGSFPWALAFSGLFLGLVWTFISWPPGGVLWSGRRWALYGALLLSLPLTLLCLAVGAERAGEIRPPTDPLGAWLYLSLSLFLPLGVSCLIFGGLLSLLGRWARPVGPGGRRRADQAPEGGCGQYEG